jgi:crotonobetainyl-CoA:carnitine CoA-transferase CaiB-like acyl-CoA transferase
MTGRIRPGSVLDGENGLFFQMTGRNQKSISFNPQSPEGIDILHRLLQDYDIVLDNSPPGLLEGWGIQYDELLRSHKQLIWCICTADGSGCCQNPDDRPYIDYFKGKLSR